MLTGKSLKLRFLALVLFSISWDLPGPDGNGSSLYML